MFIVHTHYIQKNITICRTGDDAHVYTSTVETKLILLHIYHIEIPPNTSSEKEVYKSLYHDTSPSLPKFCMASSSDPIAMLDSSTAYFKFCTPRSWMPQKGIPFYCLVHRDPYIMASKNPYKSGRIPHIYIYIANNKGVGRCSNETQPESMLV